MRVLLFDIDGTLLKTNAGGSNAIRRALEDEFGVVQACADLDFSGRTDRSLLEELLDLNHVPKTVESFTRLRDRYVSLLPHVLRERGGTILPGAMDLLTSLQGIPDLICHVMTGNLTETATHKLEYFGLRHFFDEIFGGEHDSHRDDLARRTASSVALRHGQSALRDMIIIGDTPADVSCGHAIGARVLAVCSGRHGRQELEAANPHWLHDDLTNLAEIFVLLTGSSDRPDMEQSSANSK